MHIKFKCPHCAQKIKVPRQAVGKRCKCSGCNTVCQIPSDPSEWLPSGRSEAAGPPRPRGPQARAEVTATGLLHFSCPHCKREVSVPQALAGREILCPLCDQPVGIHTEASSAPAAVREGLDGEGHQAAGRFTGKWWLKFCISWAVFFVLLWGITSLYDVVGSALVSLFVSDDATSSHKATFETLNEAYEDESPEQLLLRTVEVLQKKLPDRGVRYEIADFEQCISVFENRLEKTEINYNARRAGDKIVSTSGGLLACWRESEAGNASFALGGMIGIGEKNLREEIKEFQTALKEGAK